MDLTEITVVEPLTYTKTDLETAIREAVQLDRETVLLFIADKFKSAGKPVPFKDVIAAVKGLPVIASADDVADEDEALPAIVVG